MYFPLICDIGLLLKRFSHYSAPNLTKVFHFQTLFRLNLRNCHILLTMYGYLYVNGLPIK